MDAISALLGAAAGLLIGAAIIYILLRPKLDQALRDRDLATQEATNRANQITQLEIQLNQTQNELKTVTETHQNLQLEYRAYVSQQEERERQALKKEQEFKELLENADQRLQDAFKTLSTQALDNTAKSFLTNAEQVLKTYQVTAEADLKDRKESIEKLLDPVQKNLERLELFNQSLETKRTTAYSELKTHLEDLVLQQATLKTETTRLVRALQDSGTAGTWGEVVLERVVQLAGLDKHIAYDTQTQMTDSDGNRQRPDMVVNLPNSRSIVIDSKAPMKSYIEALESTDENTRQTLLIDHAAKLAGHVKELKRRDYSRFESAPDFTVLFVPSESAFRAAIEARPSLIEDAMGDKVVLATPTTLLALLRAVNYGWKQEQFALEARQVQAEGKKLYESLATLSSHYSDLGKSLGQAVTRFNAFGASLESTVLPAARKFKELGVASNKEVAPTTQLEGNPKTLTKPELVNPIPTQALIAPESPTLPWAESPEQASTNHNP